MKRRPRLAPSLAALLTVGGCVGIGNIQGPIQDDVAPGADPGAPPGMDPAHPSAGSPGTPGGQGGAIAMVPPAAADSASGMWLRRLTRTELGNAIQALLGVKAASVGELPDEATDFDFDRVAQSQTVIDRHIEGYLRVGDEVVTALDNAKVAALVPACATINRACAQAVIDGVGKRAFRRPVASEQAALMLDLFDHAPTPREGLNQILRFLVQSPSFLYVIERGTPVADKPGLFALDDWEIATRLSLLACETIPDAPLLAAAEAGSLHQPEQIAAQAQRLFALPCARNTVQRFFTQWMKLDRVSTIMPDTTVFPQFTADVRAAMLEEDARFLDDLTWEEQAPLPAVFSADFTFIDKRLGAIYGINNLGATVGKVMLPPERRGLLTHPNLLTTLSNPAATSPVRRGAYVYKKILCEDISPPPPTLDTSPPKDDPTLTTRQRYALRTEVGVCGSCHSTINPIGYAMENFDAIGRVRTTDNGHPIDATGGIPSYGVMGLDGGASLSMAVGQRAELQTCFARKWLRFALGRNESAADATSVDAIVQLAKQGAAMKDMLVAVSRTFAFSHRAAAPDAAAMGGTP